jgi:predicted RNA-binding protein associated with RNAse of E/G family
VYEKGQVYDFYKDIREITQTAKNEAFVIDAYPDAEVLDLYLEKL